MAATLIANRAAKASRYVDFLDTNLPADADLDQLERADWDRIAELAGEQPPSPATRAAILTGLRERRRLRTASPLEGLPT
jgi:hypothetical protein